jgi:multiple sugar transport system substrate-binding protein
MTKSGNFSRRHLLAISGGATLALRFGVHPVAARQEAVTLELWNDKPTWEPWLLQMGKLSSEQIGVNLKPVPYADTSSYQAAVKAALSSDKAPDFFTWWSGSWMADLAAADVLEDLSPLWKKYIDAGEINPGLAEPYTFAGKILGVPIGNSYYVGFSNTAVFEQHGISPPTSWDALMAAAKTLKDAGVTPFGITVQDKWPSFIWFQQVLIGSDPTLYQDLMAGRAKYTDEPVVQAMNVWKGMIESGYFNDPTIPGVGTTGQSQLAALFRQGKIGMILWGDWYIPFLTADNFKPGEQFGVYPFPKINADAPNAIIFETGPFALAKNSQQKEAALKFIDWWVSPAAQTEWFKRSPGIPTNLKVKPEDPLLQQEITFVADDKYQLLTRFWEATPPDIALEAVDQLGRFMLEPGSLQDVLSTIQQTADVYWADHPRPMANGAVSRFVKRPPAIR